MTRAIDVSQDVPGCVGGIRKRPPVDIGGGIRGGRVRGNVRGAGGTGQVGSVTVVVLPGRKGARSLSAALKANG